MAVVSELIRTEANGSISFGDYTRSAKAKLDHFQHQGDEYKVKTFKEITKLERNGMFVYESVPGTTVLGFTQDEGKVAFDVEGPEDAQITLELAEATEYAICVNGEAVGTFKTNLGGKLTLGVELEGGKTASVQVTKQ